MPAHSHRRKRTPHNGLHGLTIWVAMCVSACGGGSGPGSATSAAAFNIEVTPAQAVAFADSGRVLTVTLARTGGFTGDVTVALSNPSDGVSAESVTFTGDTASLPLSLRLDATVAAGSLTLAFDASSGSSHANATEQLSVQAPQARAQQKIADALAANTIDRDTSLLYRLYALAGDPRLPDEMVGSGGDEEDLALFNEIRQVLPQMSAAMQAAVHPFLVRPDHPDSVYRRPGTTSTRSSAQSLTREHALAAAPASSDCTVGAQWRSVRSTRIPVRVWSECYEDPVNTSLANIQASLTMGIFEKIWTPMTALMGPPLLDGDKIVDKNGNDVTDNGGDDAIDVYIVNSYSLTREKSPINTAAVGSHLGFARAADPCAANSAGKLKCSGYFVLPASFAGTASQRSTITHEFFHVLQFAHNAGLHGGWSYEAFARWSESHYDRVLGWPERVALEKVHKEWFNYFLKSDVALDWPQNKHPYASYIWPFFLEQETGGTAIIGQIWTALEAAEGPADEDRIIDAAYGFDTHFHRFAVRNVNEKLEPGNPLGKLYLDLAGSWNDIKQFPDATTRQLADGTLVSKFKPEHVNRPLVTDTEDTTDWKIKPLSAKYARFTIDRAAPPSRVEFDFTGLNDRAGLKLDALILTTVPSGADEWVSEPVPLEFDGKVVFCFQSGPSTTTVRGAFTTLRLVLSNSSLDKTVAGNIIVRPTNKPCATQWQGTIEYSQDAAETHLGGSSQTAATATTQLVFEFDPNAIDLRTVFRLRSGSFVYREVRDSVDVGNACHAVTTASGPLHPQLDLADSGDGAASNSTLYTYVGAFGTPEYQLVNELGSNATYAYTTRTTNSHCTRGDTSESSSGFLMELWQTAGLPGDITEGGTVMQGTYSFATGEGTITYKWLLKKKSE